MDVRGRVHFHLELFEVIFRQRDDIIPAGAQRRQLQVDDVDAVIEVAAEPALVYHLGKITVGRGDDADIEVDLLARADALKLIFLQNAQQLRLGEERHLADLVEKERAALRHFELTDLAALLRACERPFLIAEELAFKEVIGDARAVDGDKGILCCARSARGWHGQSVPCQSLSRP